MQAAQYIQVWQEQQGLEVTYILGYIQASDV